MRKTRKLHRHNSVRALHNRYQQSPIGCMHLHVIHTSLAWKSFSSSYESHPFHLFNLIPIVSFSSVNRSQILHEAISSFQATQTSILTPHNGTINLPSLRHHRPSCQRQLGNGSAKQQAVNAYVLLPRFLVSGLSRLRFIFHHQYSSCPLQ